MQSLTSGFEAKIRTQCERLENIGLSATNFQLFTEFKLGNFTKTFSVKSQTKIARLEFDKFICKKRELDKLVNSVVGHASTLIFFGNGSHAANSPIRGYVRTPLRDLDGRVQDDNVVQ